MEAALVTAGLVCVISAIVGGGLKAFDIEVPGVASTYRQVALGAFGIVILALGLFGPPSFGTDDGSPGEVPAANGAPQTDAPRSRTTEGAGGHTLETATTSSGVFEVSLGDVIELGVPGPGAGEIAVPGETDVYRFAGESGQQVFVDVRAVNDDPSCSDDSDLAYWLVGPEREDVIPGGGRTMATPTGCNDQRVTLPDTASYELIVESQLDSDDTGTYQLQLGGASPA